jgi:hypothetical protein
MLKFTAIRFLIYYLLGYGAGRAGAMTRWGDDAAGCGRRPLCVEGASRDGAR